MNITQVTNGLHYSSNQMAIFFPEVIQTSFFSLIQNTSSLASTFYKINGESTKQILLISMILSSIVKLLHSVI